MASPKDDIGRFSKIIYFKDRPITTPIPKKINFSNWQVETYGRGFYGITSPLPEEIQSSPPSFLPYDVYSQKVAPPKRYELMRRSSVIRIENNDMTGYKEKSPIIFIADYDPANQNLIETINKFPNKKFDFYHSLLISSPQQYEALKCYNHLLLKNFFIDFSYDSKFFIEHHDEDFTYSLKQRDKENYNDFLSRILKVILTYKKENRRLLKCYELNHTNIEKCIRKWAIAKTTVSFFFYYTDDEILNEIKQYSNEVQMLLRKTPRDFNINVLDF